MRIAFLIIVFMHGLIHILGFIKGFEIKEVKELTLPISKSIGLIWLIAAVLFLAFGIFQIANHRYAWLLGFIAVGVSQLLVILFWKDAKFGTIPNLIILVVSVISYGNFNFEKLTQLETSLILSQTNFSNERVISENDIEYLPESVKKWLRHSGAIGKKYMAAGKVVQQAEMKLKPDQENWFKANAVQYSTVDVPAFIWTVDVKMNDVIYFLGRDKFEGGEGEMLIKLNSLINLVDERGEKMNESTLQRFLGEMVWFPSLALSPYVTWHELNDTSAMATMEYKGTKGSGTFYFNSDGDFVRFSTLRYNGNEPDAKRFEWVLLVDQYKTFEGIKVPSRMTATWKFEKGDWTWLKLEILDIKYDENAI